MFQDLTTEHTERIIYLNGITEILPPSLCVLKIIILLSLAIYAQKYLTARLNG
jgi:hypothetical protein